MRTTQVQKKEGFVVLEEGPIDTFTRHFSKSNSNSKSKPSSSAASIPVLDNPLLPRRRHPTRRSRIPFDTSDSAFSRSDLVHHLAALPIPEADPSPTVSTRDEASIGADSNVGPVSCRVMPSEALLPILLESVSGSVHYDLIVAALEGYALT